MFSLSTEKIWLKSYVCEARNLQMKPGHHKALKKEINVCLPPHVTAQMGVYKTRIRIRTRIQYIKPGSGPSGSGFYQLMVHVFLINMDLLFNFFFKQGFYGPSASSFFNLSMTLVENGGQVKIRGQK